MAPKTDYQVALEKLQLVASQIDGRMYDTARTVLTSASLYGHLDRAEHLSGRLQHDALQALLMAIDKHDIGYNVAKAHRQLRSVLRRLSLVQAARDKQVVRACCTFVIARLPHVAQINAELREVTKSTERKRYVSAYEHLKRAQGLLEGNEDLTPPPVTESVKAASGTIMLHLMQNNSPQIAVAISTDLQRRGLIQD